MKKALFLTGGPGSGKAVFIKELFQYIPHKEYRTEQLKSNITEKFIIISCNAYKLADIIESKEILQQYGYTTACLYIDVDYNVAIERLKSRNVNESVLNARFNSSKQNIPECSSLFEHFYLHENNFNITKEIISEISEFIMKFLFTEKKKIKKKFPEIIRLSDKKYLPVDRIGDEFSVRNSGIGYPSTVGPYYADNFNAEFSDTLPMLASIERTIVPMEKLSHNDLVKTKTRIAKIKKVIKNGTK